MSTRQFGGVNRFLELLDAPSSYAGQAGYVVKVNATETGLEFGVGGGGGSQTPWLSDIDADGFDLNNLNVLQAQSLYDSTNNFVANLVSGALADLVGVASVDVNNRELIDASGTTRLNWYNPGVTIDDRLIIGGGSDDGINDLQLAGSASILFGSQITQKLIAGNIFSFDNPAFAQNFAELNLWTQSDGSTALSNGDVLTWDAANSRWAGAAGGGGGLYALIDASNQPFTEDIGVTVANPRFTLTDSGDPDSAKAYIEKLTVNNEFRLISQSRLFSIGNGLTLAGATYSSSLSYTSTGALSFSFWFKTTNSGDAYFIGSSSASSDFRWGSGVLSFSDEAAGLSRYFSSAATAGGGVFNNGAWKHIALTISADRLTVICYLNGAVVPVTQAGSIGGNFVINRIFATNGLVTGSFDDFIIYTKELSAGEVSGLYNGGVPQEITNMTDVYAYYKLNATSGTTAVDSSGNGRTLTLTGGTPVWSTGIVAPVSPSPTDTDVLKLINNTTAGSYGTLTLGYRNGSFGTSNVYEGLTHRMQRLGSTVLSLDGTQVIAGHGNTDNRGNSILLGSGLTASLTSGTEPLFMAGYSITGGGQRCALVGVSITAGGNSNVAALGYGLSFSGSNSGGFGHNLTNIPTNQIRIGLTATRCFIVDNNGQVSLGDGAAAPAYLLDMVYGAAGGAITQRIKTSTAGQSASLILDGSSTGSGSLYLYKGGGSNWRIYQDGSNNLNFYTFGSAPNAASLIINYSTHAATFAGILTATSVGAGTSPAYPLHVNGTSVLGNLVYIGGHAVSGAALGINAVVGNQPTFDLIGHSSPSANVFQIWQDSSPDVLKFYIDTSYNIGLGNGVNIITGTTTGSIVFATNLQKGGFWGATPVIRQALASYVTDNQSTSYSGIDNLQVGTVYAQVSELELLRVAYENLRAAHDDMRTKLQTIGILG